ncbi:hypothetical protein AGMMS49525_02630 [Bacteroidia bacterium]|nr:hypothetical protein AGMMS49525_02630 [Bacteroidia bacterium]
MDNKHVIASAIADNELAKAFSELVAERWDNFDVSPFMAYLVDTCEVSALPYLAEQFDCDGLQGFEMVENEAQRRDLIKKSIALHKFIGTPWAVREACRTVGFPIIVLQEGIAGNDPANDWAKFRVLVEADVEKHITAEHSRRLRLFVEFYKNERSHLIEFGFYQMWSDALEEFMLKDKLALSLNFALDDDLNINRCDALKTVLNTKNMDTLKQMKGTLHLTAVDKQGAVLWDFESQNLIVNTGYNLIAQALGGTVSGKIDHLAVGTNGSPAAESNTSITGAIPVAFTAVTYPTIASVRFAFSIGYNDCVGMSITEFGLIATSGTLFSRKVRSAIEKTDEMSISGYWDIVIHPDVSTTTPSPSTTTTTTPTTTSTSGEPSGGEYEIVVTGSEGISSMSGNGIYLEGTPVTLVAATFGDYYFDGWYKYESGYGYVNKVSSNPVYQLIAHESASYKAVAGVTTTTTTPVPSDVTTTTTPVPSDVTTTTSTTPTTITSTTTTSTTKAPK